MHTLIPLVLSLLLFLVRGQTIDSPVRQHYLRHLRDSIVRNQVYSTNNNYTLVTLATQCTVDKLVYLSYITKRWKGPISVAVYYTAEDEDLFNSYKSKFEGTSIHFSPYFSEDSSLFPINKLRNMAVEAVKTPYYMLIDIDMLPSSLLEDYITYMITKVYLSDRLVIIIPSFVYQYTKNIDNLRSVLNQVYPSIPTTKDILLQCMDSSQCNIYRLNDSTHLYLYEEWFYDYSLSNYYSMVNCFQNHIQEPYLLLKKTADLPSFDERFVNYGYNYISYIETLRFTGYEFGILNNGFLISLPSTISPFKKTWLDHRDESTPKSSDVVYHEFLTELHQKPDESIVYICDS